MNQEKEFDVKYSASFGQAKVTGTYFSIQAKNEGLARSKVRARVRRESECEFVSIIQVKETSPEAVQV